MEPFTITCATCESRIRVRNPQMVGQLATCPKCSSMIMIAPSGATVPNTPARGVAGGDRIEVAHSEGFPVDSMAVTKEGLASDIENLLPPPAATQVDDDEYHLVDADDAGVNAVPPIQIGSSAHINNLHAPGWQPGAAPHIPSSQWTSDSTNRTRQYLLVAFLGVTGVVLAAALFFGFLRWYSSERASDVLTSQPSQTVDVEKPNANDSPIEITPQSSELGGTDTSNAQPIPAVVASVPESPVIELPAVELPAVDFPAMDLPTTSVDQANALPTNAAGDDQPIPQQLPKQLAPFAEMLNYQIQPQFPDAIEILSEAPVTAEDLGLTSTVGLPEIPPIDVVQQSQISFSGLVIGSLPLSQFVSLWSNLSGIPTVVDLDSLATAAIDRNQRLALGLVKSATVGSLIPQLGQGLGLRAESRDNLYLQLVATTESIEQKLPAAVSLEGLVVDATAEEWLKGTLQQLLPNQSTDQNFTWQVVDGALLRPQRSDGQPLDAQVWFSVVKLIESWRLATGQSPTLDQYGPQQLSAEFIPASEVSGLDSVLKQVAPQSRPVAQVLPRICQEAGVQAWIDWANLGSVGLGPQTTAVYVTAARPLRRVLADYAAEFSLVVAVIDRESLWITTNQAYRSRPQLYVVPSDGRSAEEWKSQLRPYTPAASGGVGVGAVVVIPTPDEKFMLVRCCRPVVGL